MINIVNVRSKRLYQAEFNRQMITLEHTFLRELRPLLGRQFFNSAALVQAGELNTVDHAVDLARMRLVRMFRRHYKRVAASFSRKAYKILDKSQGKEAIISHREQIDLVPSETKSPKDEFWLSMNKWSRRQTATKIRGIQTTTKKVIAKIIRRGQSDGESHREIAKRIRKTSAAINPHRARTIALTETHGASVKSVDVAVASTRIEMEREWVSAKDLRTRTRGLKNPWEHYKSFPRGADGERVAQDGLFKGTGQAMRFPGDPRGSAGNIIRCLTSYKTAIYTSKGWKRVKDIVIGDLVLTHRNRFKKVLRLNSSLYEGEVVTIKIEDQGRTITVTPEHPFLVMKNSSRFARWKNAKDIVLGDIVGFMASYCQYCGKLIPYYLKYCNQSCGSKVTTLEQWRDPEHRKNMNKKASAQMKREYANGTRDRFEIIKKARKVHFDKWGPGGSFGVLVKTPEFQKKRLQAIEKKYGSVLNMLKKFAFPALGKVNYSGSKIEQAMAAFLGKNDRSFVSQFPVGRRRIDFYIKTEKLFIEVDGYPFHEDKEGERKRDLEILIQYPDHQIVHVDYKLNPPKWEFFDLVALNHTGTFSQIGMRVRFVSKRQLKENIKIYNFAVEDDESYIASGFVTHNCGCVLVYHSVKRTQDLKPYEPEDLSIPAKTIENADKIAKTLKAPIVPKTSDEAFDVYSTNYEKYYSDDPLKKQHLANWKDRMKGIKDINEERFLSVQNAINSNYLNNVYREAIDISKQKDIVILLKKRIGSEGGLSRGNVSFVFDGKHLMEKSKTVIPGNSLVGLETLLRHEKAHFLFDQHVSDLNRKSWVKLYDKKPKEFWAKELTEYSSTNSSEGFAELFTLVTDSSYVKERWRFDPFIKNRGDNILDDYLK